MPVYQVDIEKSTSPSTGVTVYWTNVYYVDQASLASAQGAAASIVAIEKAIHATTASFTKSRVRQYNPLSSSGTITTLTGTGARSAAAGVLPLFNVFRVDFSVAAGRPNRKYIRGPVLPGDNQSGGLAPTTLTLLSTAYITPLIGLGCLCDTQGQPVLSGAAYPFVGMRQLRRGSKRKTTAVLS